MSNINVIKKEITKYSVIAAVIAGIVSLPVFGVSILFPYGLAVGTCASVICLHIIGSTIKKAVDQGRTAPVSVGFFVRVALYIAALCLAATTAPISFLGAVIGLLIPHLIIYIRFALRPAVRRKLGKDPQYTYVTDTRSNVFFREPWIVRDNKGKTYMSHKHYRRKKVEIAK